MNDELLDKLYEFQWELRDKLTSAINIPILGISIVGGFATTIALDTHFDQGAVSSMVSGALLLVGLSLVFAVWCVASTLLTRAYLSLPSAGKMDRHHSSLLAWHRDNGTPDAETVARSEFALELRERKISAVDRNSEINQSRAAGTRSATIGVVASLVFCGVAAVGYYFQRGVAPEPAYKVTITNPNCV
jgi:hypothetical protein